MKILLNTIDNAYSFSTSCDCYFDGDIEIKQGKKCINGKSVLGLFSLNLLEPLDATIISDDKEVKENFYSYIKIWEVGS